VTAKQDTARSIDSARTWKRNEVLRVLLLAGFMLGAMVTIHYLRGRDSTLGNVDRLRQWVGQWGHWSWFMFLAVGTGLVSVGFPRIALAAVAGALFNIWWGIVLAQVATSLAAAPGFYYARFIGRNVVARKMGRRLQRLDGLLREHGLMVLLLIRLCPVGNAFITGCIAGVSAIRFGDYMLASFLGFLPETIIFALLGQGLAADVPLRLTLGVVLFVLFSLGFGWYYKKSAFAAQIIAIMREE
jgi:uncharacterized membrane protein YdjX (TVP38/TMEM64 family)